MRIPYSIGSGFVALALAPVAVTTQNATTPERPARQVWIDFDEDGLLDLYTTAVGRADVLLRNLGDGAFAQATVEAGLGGNASQAARTADFDRDERTDLLLVTAEGDLRLFRASGGPFREVSAEVGLGGAHAAVHAEWVDYDEDGWVDLWIENPAGQPVFFHNQAGLFERVDLGLPEVSTDTHVGTPAVTGVSTSYTVPNGRPPAEPRGSRIEGTASRVSDAIPTPVRRPILRDPALVGVERSLIPTSIESVAIGGVVPLAFSCLPSILDQSGGCLMADSTPALGRLHPLSVDFNVDGSGNVGMGTTAQTYRLQVDSSGDAFRAGNASSWLEVRTAGNSRLGLGDGFGNEAGFVGGGQNGVGENTLTVAACDDLGNCPTFTTFHESGRVGIGTTSPTESLHVVGNTLVSGEVNRTPTGAANMVPIAYGFIADASTGALDASSGNVSASWDAGSSRYVITITGEGYFFSRYVTVVTPINDGLTWRTGSLGGDLLVYFEDSVGTGVQTRFQFVTFKP